MISPKNDVFTPKNYFYIYSSKDDKNTKKIDTKFILGVSIDKLWQRSSIVM